MSFISHAQNFEDVMLWRALKHLDTGFYVDVGANDPKIESVTLAFYERGWRGINIEPLQSCYDKLCAERPLDINLRFAVGDRKGKLPFYEVKVTGWSTLDQSLAERYKADGYEVLDEDIEVKTLDQILGLYAESPIHFLKIDVEGAEEKVLKGLNLQIWRPWIILIEALSPNSFEESHSSWEPLLLENGYQFVYFDGLNRFYIANEQSNLSKFFAYPPNVNDHFVTISEYGAKIDAEVRKKVIFEKEDRITSLILQLKSAEGQLQSTAEQLRAKEDQLQSTAEQLRAKEEELHSTVEQLQAKENQLRSTGEQLRANEDQLQSTSEQLRAKEEKLNNTLHQLLGAKTEIEDLRAELVETYNTGKVRNEQLQTSLNEAREEVEKSHIIITEQNRRIELADGGLNFLQGELDKVYRSKSYRITAPLRAAFGFARVLRDHWKGFIKRFLVWLIWLIKKPPFVIHLARGIKKRFPSIENTWDRYKAKLGLPPSYWKVPTPGQSSASMRDNDITSMTNIVQIAKQDEEHFFALFQHEVSIRKK